MPDVPVLISTSTSGLARLSRGTFAVTGLPWPLSSRAQISCFFVQDADGSMTGVGGTAVKVTRGEGGSATAAIQPYADAAEGEAFMVVTPPPPSREAADPATISSGIVRLSPRALFIPSEALPFPAVAACQFRSVRSEQQAMRFGLDYARPHFDAGAYDGWTVATSDPEAAFLDADGLSVTFVDFTAPATLG